MRPTVNDIAREAGVSLATVDRVLNARPGVREKTVKAVNDAIARLGYVRDLTAANLARGRTYRVAVVLPDTESQFIQSLAEALTEAGSLAATSRTELRLHRFPAEDPHALAALLGTLPGRDYLGVALMAPETPILRDAVRQLRANGIPVVALVSDLPNAGRDHFIGIDNRAAGRTAGVIMGRFLGGGPGQVLVLGQSLLARDMIERRRGFDEVMQRDFPGLEALQSLETHGSPATLRQVVREMLANAPDVRGIYAMGGGNRTLTQVLDEMGLSGKLTVICHELTPHVRAALIAGRITAVITQNLGHLARSTLRVLRAKADHQPLDESQEQIRIEIVLRENLPEPPVSQPPTEVDQVA
ncbi:LacI family DNA-binding transcriptional regulator [Tabrizicola sp.]|uniref:LacI family DNA-binding transcriptional regulator n=1 Tax=Tabrizicola sp. TaxID=2005166 RepID=UPI002734A7E9|nr:LacI family DNA-binding transcriptional regulator [Tabrizicola sp.]MDP3195454.1 LacI family DNA-binding transcriptional regulator [Tabrizicola sp.]